MQFLNELSPEEQRPAVQAFLDGQNVAAVAGAGAGKTRTLTTLLAALLCPSNPNRADVEEIVAFTYTEKAAGEMKGSLRKRVVALGRQGTPDERAGWRAVAERLPLLSIGTFHSFCQRLISAYPVEAGVDPSFTVVDEVTADLMIDEVTHEMLQAMRDTGSPELDELTASLSIDQVAGLVASVLKTLRLRGVSVSRAIQETEAAGGSVLEALDAFRESVEGWLAAGNKSTARPAVASRWANLKDRLAADRVDALLVDEIDRLAGTPTAAGSLKPLVGQMKEANARVGNWYASRLAVRLLGLVDKVWSEYDARKQALGLLNFDDLVWKARQALGTPAVQEQVAGRIRHILVDEFQDTDQLQVEVIRLLLGLQDPEAPLPPGRLFVVGDRKQSIYRFRGAQVEVFDGVVDRLVNDGGQLKPLKRNYRSRPAIITFANELFRRLGVVVTDGDEMGEQRRQGIDPSSVELLLCDGAAEGSKSTSREEEAALIAARIRQLFASGMLVEDKEKGGERALELGDIAILLRSMTNVESYTQALYQAGIPHFVVSGRGLFDKAEVQDLVNLLQAIINPADSVSLFGALRGPAFALRDDTLFLLMDGSERDLQAGLSRAAELLPPGEEQDRAVRAARILAGLRESVRREPADSAMDEVFRQTGFLEILAASKDGKQQVANIRKIARWVREGGSSLHDLPALVRWLQLSRDREVREGPAATAAEKDPTTVKLLTDHKAKGLEWPVVILADTGSVPRGKSDGVRYRPGRGLSLRLKGPMGEELANQLWDEFEELEKAEAKEEEKRLFYVGCTRARDLLIISGRVAPAKGSWLAQALEHVDAEDWAGGLVRKVQRADVAEVERGVLAPAEAAATVEALPTLATLLERTGPVVSGYGTDPVPASSSKLMDLQACVRRYYLRYVLGMPEPRAGGSGFAAAHVDEVEPTEWVDPTVRGQFIHWICERLREPEQVPQLIEQALHAFGVAGTPQAVPLINLATEQVGRFVKSPLFERMRCGRVEAEASFTLEIGGLVIDGRIDALGVDAAGEPVLVDYKTNQVTAAGVAEAAHFYELQMGIYAVAARSMGYPVKEAILYFTEPGVAHAVPVDLAAVEERVAELGARLRAGSAEIGDYPQNRDSCGKCRFRAVCGT